MSNAGGVDQYSVNVKVVGEWGRGIDSMRDLGLICRNKLLRPIGIMAASDTLSVFLMSVVPVTLDQFGLGTARIDTGSRLGVCPPLDKSACNRKGGMDCFAWTVVTRRER